MLFFLLESSFLLKLSQNCFNFYVLSQNFYARIDMSGAYMSEQISL